MRSACCAISSISASCRALLCLIGAYFVTWGDLRPFEPFFEDPESEEETDLRVPVMDARLLVRGDADNRGVRDAQKRPG